LFRPRRDRRPRRWRAAAAAAAARRRRRARRRRARRRHAAAAATRRRRRCSCSCLHTPRWAPSGQMFCARSVHAVGEAGGARSRRARRRPRG